ncbi:MAG TPA: hypothetical protein VGH78_06455 [Solirubrobacteraceae bacterium]
MPPEERFVPRFAAEPPQEELPYGRWQERLQGELLDGLARLQEAPADLGDAGEIRWYPDRSWHGRTYVPATLRTSGDYEVFGYVRFVPGGEDGAPSDFYAHVDFTDELAEHNPDWRMDLCEEVVGSWRGDAGALAAMTLVWGRPLLSGGQIATAELADLAVDQCELIDERFTLLAPDDYRHDLLEIKLFDARGRELARESLYAGDEDEDDDEDEDANTSDGETAAD